MRALDAGLNLLLGTAYVGIGIMTAIEMKRDWRKLGFSHFGAAVIAMAFTCGPHHFAHGIHVAWEGRQVGLLHIAYVLIGLPAGATWVLLRIEAFRGGRGDRFVPGSSRLVGTMPLLAALYAAFFVGATTSLLVNGPVRLSRIVLPNVLLVLVYVTIGVSLLRTQIRNRQTLGGWSLSGSSLAALFPTCAVMHAGWAVYALTGTYHYDIHGFVIDWLSIPAALYFLWVVQGLHREALRDWNRSEPPAILVG